jgi:hypothetical protein
MAGMKEWAQLGAARRVEQIQAELAEIRRAFPALGAGMRAGRRVLSGGGGGTTVPADGEEQEETNPRKRRAMSAAQRKAVGLRMKKYWAARRKTASGRAGGSVK